MGIQIREIFCGQKIGPDKYKDLDDTACDKPKPEEKTKQECAFTPCAPQWEHSKWSQVSKNRLVQEALQIFFSNFDELLRPSSNCSLTCPCRLTYKNFEATKCYFVPLRLLSLSLYLSRPHLCRYC